MDEGTIARVFVGLVESLDDDFDSEQLLKAVADRCLEVLEVAGTGLLFDDKDDQLQFVAATSAEATYVELSQLHRAEGPCLDCYRTGEAVLVEDIGAARDRWPDFVAAALHCGFGTLLALPMRHRGKTIGTLNLFGVPAGLTLDHGTVAVAQAVADLAANAIVQQRELRSSRELSRQLQAALDSRVVIEQAKGILAHRHGTTLDSAFEVLRTGARTSRRRLLDLANDVVHGRWDGELPPSRGLPE